MKKIVVLIFVVTCFAITGFSQEKQDSLIANKPKAMYQIGNVKVTVWENQRQGKYGEYTEKNYKVERVYKKGEEWKSTNHFNLTELLELRAVLDKAISEEGVKVKEEKE